MTAAPTAPAPPKPATTGSLPTTDWHDTDPAHRHEVGVDQYVAFRRDGFLIVRGLVPEGDIAELREHTALLMRGELPEQQAMDEYDPDAVPFDPKDHGNTLDRDNRKQATRTVRHLTKPPAHLSPEEKAQYFLRIHMLHRELELHERYLLHPRVLDVLEVLIGPDVLAKQTMLFLKPPGKPGQGWHQDAYYIPSYPDTLIGAWIAIDDADEYNGGMWFAKGSGNEPIYPPCPEIKYGFGDKLVKDITYVKNVSEPDDEVNHLTPVAAKYDQVLGAVKAGDVVLFNGHVLHRSKQNITKDRFRRAFVSHYCNARSFTPWGRDSHNPAGYDEATGSTNGSHILARGDTHLAYAEPRFGTPCAALVPAEKRREATEQTIKRIAALNNGLMGCSITDLESLDHDHDDDHGDAGGGY